MEKDYKELYEKIANSDWFKKAYHDKSLGECPIVVEELEDSEDEKIRKEIIHYILYKADGVSEEQEHNWVTYLEKQKEQKPRGVEPHNPDGSIPYDMSFEEAQSYISSRGFDIPWNDGDIYIDERHLSQTIGNIIRWVDEHPKEQKPAEWSEEDEKILNEIIETIEATRVEASRNLPNCSVLLESYWTMLHWLKSIRPQSHWKPSKEQMEALYNVEFKEFKKFGPILESLYNDLKKL